MPTRPETVAHLLDLLSDTRSLTAKKMFGEYGLYLGDRMVALICDDNLFLKPTPGALALLPDNECAKPFSRAKPYLLLTDALDDPDLVGRALRAVANDMPPPKAKKVR